MRMFVGLDWASVEHAVGVVDERGAVRAQLAAIEAYGAVLHRCAPTIAAREAMCAQVAARSGGRIVHPYTDPHVIAGQGTAALELLTAVPDLDVLVVPLGGGTLVVRKLPSNPVASQNSR